MSKWIAAGRNQTGKVTSISTVRTASGVRDCSDRTDASSPDPVAWAPQVDNLSQRHVLPGLVPCRLVQESL